MKQLERWAEHYKDLASDVTNHSRNRSYWEHTFGNVPFNQREWEINENITISEIKNVICSMKNNKAPGPDGLPIEFYKAFYCNPDLEEKYTAPSKCLEIIFNKIWNGSFPKNWNTASIVSIPKKGDLSDCNNYRGISLINVGLKIISKIVTERITKYAFDHNFIRPEQFGFRNHEECISLFVSIREICQRRKFQGKFTYLAFLDLKKAYDSVPIFNILTKIYHLGIRGKCFDFLYNLYLSSKARAKFFDMLSEEFPIDRGVRQGCPLSPILFNLFINDVLNNCEKFGVNIGNKKCCGGLFADDIVLIAPSEKNLQKLLNRVFRWANKNEMTFGINKCATMVIKPINYISPLFSSDPTFYIGMYSIPKTTSYTYLGIPFTEDLLITHIIQFLHSKVRRSLFSLSNFFMNKYIPFAFKKKVLQSYVISKVIYFSPLLGSNKHRTARIQSLINTGLFWCIGSYAHKNTLGNSKNNSEYLRHNPTMSTYAISRDLEIPPIAGTCAALQVQCFKRWAKSKCIIRDLIQYIPKLSHYSWTKETRTLYKKLKKKNCNSTLDIKKLYWNNILKFQGIKGQNYEINKFIHNRQIIIFSIQYPQFNLGFSWIIRLRCGFYYNTIIAIRSGRVSSDCPRTCPCCGHGDQSFDHWVFYCPALSSFRCNSLNFINDLFIIFSRKYRDLHSTTSFRSIVDFEKYINHFILMFLLGGTLALDELHIDVGERRRLTELLIKSSAESSVPYLVGLADFLTKSIPVISSSFKLLFDKYCKITTRSVDVVPIRHRSNVINSNINNNILDTGPSNSLTHSSLSNEDRLGESLVDTTLSILKMLLLSFIFISFFNSTPS